MSNPDVRAVLARFRARGLSLEHDGSRLRLSGRGLTESDRTFVREHGAELLRLLRDEDARAAHLRSLPRNAEAPAQAETAPPDVVAPTAPDALPSSLLTFEERERARHRQFRGKPITPADVKQCLLSSGEWEDYRAGRLSADAAYERTYYWLRSRHAEVGAFLNNVFSTFGD